MFFVITSIGHFKNIEVIRYSPIQLSEAEFMFTKLKNIQTRENSYMYNIDESSKQAKSWQMLE